jgi:hypothetical protein
MESHSFAGAPSSDHYAHGRAALLLVESLIHGLTARSILSVAEAVEIVEIARDAQIAIDEDADAPSPSSQRAASLLSALMESLSIDLPSVEGQKGARSRRNLNID